MIYIVGMVASPAKFGRKMKRLQKKLNFFAPVPDLAVDVDVAQYDIAQSQLAAQIIESWFPHDETELLAGAPEALCGRFSKYINNKNGTAELTLKVFYDPFIEFKNAPLPTALFLSQAFFIWHIREIGNGQIEIRYEWIGNDMAMTDIFSTDYKVLHYLIKRTEKEFELRNYKRMHLAAAPPSAASQRSASGQISGAGKAGAGKQVTKWWRTYEASEHGERVYSTWPNPQDYSESVQNPASNFKDEGLKKCSPVLNSLGIPRVTSGMFASVYELKDDDQQWAVRCFDTRLRDQQERYKAISSFILADDLPYTVDFHYLEDGIKCSGSWYPILKMTWVAGQSIDAYVRDHLHDVEAMRHLRQEFQVMMMKLKVNGVAHGDLQHGNILVDEITVPEKQAFIATGKLCPQRRVFNQAKQR